MCGIIGIKYFESDVSPNDVSNVKKALQIQEHRGPDYQHVTSKSRVVLGHNRLSILDLNPRSNQPFADNSGRYEIVFNGEIYNYPELKNELLKKGYVFRTSSDTEVLLNHLIEYGEQGINDLNGCFAFGFYDHQEDVLILARDHMGINPILFSVEDNRILFASELRAFFQLTDEHEINHEALSLYFRFTYIPAPHTILKNVQKLLPGHYLKVHGKFMDVVQYWTKTPKSTFVGDQKEAISEARRLIERSVIKRMDADVPLGTFLSGGIDSSIVSAIAAQNKDGLHTFSIGFNENQFFDETKYSKLVAQHIGSIHHPIQLNNNEIVENFADVLDSFDEPFADSSAIAMYFLSKAAKNDLTVCLSGDGADELLAGYNKHKAFVKSKNVSFPIKLIAKTAQLSKNQGRHGKLQNTLRQLSKFGDLLDHKWPDNYWGLAQFSKENTVEKMLLKPLKPDLSNYEEQTDSLYSFLLMDQSFVLPNDMLKKVDVMSMRNSLEVRTPFLDKEFVHFCNSLPESLKLNNGQGKSILRQACGDLLPEEIFTRSKKGFEVPLHAWISSTWKETVDAKWFDKSYLEEQNIFNVTFVNQLKNTFFGKNPGETATLIWSYIIFQHWYAKWITKK